MKLYYAPGACSLSTHITLCETGATFEIEKVDLRTKQTESGRDFHSINSLGYVPALELDDGTVLTEGPAIVQYLADKAPQANIVAAPGTLERTQQQSWLNFVGNELHKNLGSLFNPTMTPENRESTIKRSLGRMAHIEKSLEGKQFLGGDAYSVADGYAFTVLNWTRLQKISLDEFPNIQAYLGRVAERPAVQQAMKSEGLIK